MLGEFKNTDRRIEELDIEPVDIVLLTLDEEKYLEKCLDSVYREIPVNKLIVVDGGSKDKTVEILQRYPRIEIHVRPDLKTSGKSCEFALSHVETPWVVIIEGHIELPAGWYDEMIKHKQEYDFIGCRRIMRYEFEREQPVSLDMDKRPLGAPWLMNRDCIRNYHVDDDYMWRATDVLLRQVAEKDGFKFGKISETFHYHDMTDNVMYASDAEKRSSRLVFTEPEMEILDYKNWQKRLDDVKKAIVKYIDPEYIYPHNDRELFRTLLELDSEWIRQTNPKWSEELNKINIMERILFGRRLKKLRKVFSATLSLMKSIKNAIKEYIKNIRIIFKTGI
jgi:glycosyltransferase involved in cell wall biosynthesis